jgi:peroxiredoxin Q/BCP
VKSAVFATVLLLGSALPATAALKNGAAAPDFTAQATLGGKQFVFNLADALNRGPVVLYFYPAAFTQGCTSRRMTSPRRPTATRHSAPR